MAVNDQFAGYAQQGLLAEPMDISPLGDFGRGLQYSPFDLLGAPVDLMNMGLQSVDALYGAQNVLGSERPFLGSEYLIDKYADLGEATGLFDYQRPTGSLAETAGRITGGVLAPTGGAAAFGRGVDLVEAGMDAYAAGAPARVAERARTTTLGAGIDPTAIVDDMIVARQGGAGDVKPFGGLTVREDVPNFSSISASLDNYEIVPDIQDVSMKDIPFPQKENLFYSPDDFRRVEDLAGQIKESQEINPLIVVQDKEGTYVLEGAHRLAALNELGVTSFPAVVVRDLDELPALADDAGGLLGVEAASAAPRADAPARAGIGHNRPPVVVGQTPYIVTNELRGTQFRTAELPDGSRTLVDAAGDPYIEEKTLNKLLTGVPHNEMTSVFTPPPPGVLQPEVAVSPEMFENSWMLNLSGDRTRYGNLSRVNDIDLYGGGVDLEGGDDFMRSLRATWASAPGAVSAIENQVKNIRKGLLGGDPDAPIYGVTTNMAERSGDFAVDTAETIMRMIPASPIKKADFQEFEASIKAKYPDYPGMKDPDKALEWLMKDAETKGAGNRRLFFVQEAAKGKYQKAGFPDIGSIRAAISKPETRFMPYGRTGASIGLLAPEGQLANRLRFGDIENPHKTYPDMIGGPLGYRGGYEVTVDRSLGFPDAYSTLYGRGSDAAGVRRVFDIGRETQFMRPDVVDPQMQFIEDQQRMLRNAGLLNDIY